MKNMLDLFLCPVSKADEESDAMLFNQTHSRKAQEARERKLESCVICARSCWLEDMERLKLFVDAEKAAVDESGGDGPRREIR